MNMITNLSFRQALHHALTCAGIENDGFECLLRQYEDGLYYFRGHTAWMEYEFYVDACSGEVLGMNAEPFADPEALCLSEPNDDALSAVA